MILLLGGSGYIGSAFEAEIRRRSWPFTAISRREADYSRFDTLIGLLRRLKPAFVVNCAGFTGKPNVDACETAQADTLQGNTLLPTTISHACAAAGVPWGHVSSGCIFAGAKISDGAGGSRIERDLTKPEVRAMAAAHPERFKGFDESDPPNFSFRDGPCSFYSGTKALAEEAITGVGECYVWRLRIPFDEEDSPRNFLTKVQRYARVYDNINSLSHRGDFARACLDLHSLRAPYGIYNVTNPGWSATRDVVRLIQKTIAPGRNFEFWENDEEFYRIAAKTPRSNCILDSSKILAAGVALRPLNEALDAALRAWRGESL